VTFIEAAKQKFPEIRFRQVREAPPQPLYEELPGKFSQLEGLEQALLWRHLSQNPEIDPVIGSRFDAHLHLALIEIRTCFARRRDRPPPIARVGFLTKVDPF
jgi:hypothetical protein